MKKILIALAALAALGATQGALAQTSGEISMSDQEQLLIARIQGDKRAIVLSTLQLTDAEVQAFTPIFDKYQAEMKTLATKYMDVLNKFASNYDSMTDDAAEEILKESFEVREDRIALTQDYAKRMGNKLPATKVLRWVQIENKITALLDWQMAQIIPLAN
jgi:formate dehydrogenase maturation protein FdhE